MTRLAIPVLLLLAALGGPATADPKAEAKVHIEKARIAHAAGKFDVALAELTAAYELDPLPQLLFGIGQVHKKLGACKTATSYYERFLATHPKPSDADIVRQAIEQCKATLATSPKVEPKVEPTPEEPTPKVEPTPTIAPVGPEPETPGEMQANRSTAGNEIGIDRTTSPTSTGKDWIGYGLVGGGLAATAGGLVLYRSALQRRDAADNAGSYQDFEDQLGSARSRRNVSYAVIGAGAALLIGGVLHLLLHDTGGEHPVAIAPTTGGAIASFGGSF